MAEAVAESSCPQEVPPVLATGGEWDDKNRECAENCGDNSGREKNDVDCAGSSSSSSLTANNLNKTANSSEDIISTNVSTSEPFKTYSNSNSIIIKKSSDTPNANNSNSDDCKIKDKEIENDNNDVGSEDKVKADDEDDSNQTYYEATTGEPELVLAFGNRMKLTNDVTPTNAAARNSPLLSEEQLKLSKHKTSSSLLVSTEMDKHNDSVVSSKSCGGNTNLCQFVEEDCEGAVGLVPSLADAVKGGNMELLKDVNVYPLISDFIRKEDGTEPAVVLRRKRGRNLKDLNHINQHTTTSAFEDEQALK